MAKAEAEKAARLPRGAKQLTAVFFAAANDLPDATRPAVIKAALAAIRDELVDRRRAVSPRRAAPAPDKARGRQNAAKVMPAKRRRRTKAEMEQAAAEAGAAAD